MNFLLITTDQQRADSLGVYGNPVCETPNLDALAVAGARFTACRCQNPYCQPSRATILTGTYPSTHGVTSIGRDLPEDVMERSLPALLAAAGYRTALFGKGHFATAFPTFPTRKLESVEGSGLVDPDWCGPYAGFEHAELVLFGHNLRLAPALGSWNWCFGPPPFGLQYARHLYRNTAELGRERLRLMQPEAAARKWPALQTWHNALPEEDHPTTWVGERARSWLQKVEGPFFAWVSFCDPHQPMDPPAPWSGKYSPSDVEPHVPNLDPGELRGKPPIQARLAAGLKGSPFEWAAPGTTKMSRQDLATMTAGYYGMVSQIDAQVGRLLEVLDQRGLAEDTVVLFTSDHGDLLGDHAQLFKGPLHYEGLLRVPLIARGPGFEAGQVVDDPVGLVDLAPTVLQWAGQAPPEWMEGRPLLDGPRELVLTENDHEVGFPLPLRTLTTRRYKITRYQNREGVGELYDLQEDPGELVNLWGDQSRWPLRSELLGLLAEKANKRVRAEPQVGLIG